MMPLIRDTVTFSRHSFLSPRWRRSKATSPDLNTAFRRVGPPSASPSHAYTPKFWIKGEGSPRRTYEPLVLSWRSHDKTVLQLDPGFAMTYGLVPRNLGNGETRWDDPAGPM